MPRPRHLRFLAMPAIAFAAIAFAVIVVACNTSAPEPSPAGVGPTFSTADQLSLPPARETTAPAPVETPGALPSVGTPQGTAPPPPEVVVEYVGQGDDLAGFITAYRDRFATDLAADQIGAAGARLCTYLQRHADAEDRVPIATAIGEADVNEPGYPREVWVAAFELVTTYYCSEFVVVGTGDVMTP